MIRMGCCVLYESVSERIPRGLRRGVSIPIIVFITKIQILVLLKGLNPYIYQRIRHGCPLDNSIIKSFV